VPAEAICSFCRTANRLGAKFCKSCGQPLTPTEAAAPSAPPPRPAQPAAPPVRPTSPSLFTPSRAQRDKGPPPVATRTSVQRPAPARAPFTAPLEPETDWRRYALIAAVAAVALGVAAASWYIWLAPATSSSLPATTTPRAAPTTPTTPSAPAQPTTTENPDATPPPPGEAVETSGNPPPDDYTRKRVREWLSWADHSFQQGDYCNALASCNEALSLDPNNKEALALRDKIQKTINILGTQCN
jgi:hypothetical protein